MHATTILTLPVFRIMPIYFSGNNKSGLCINIVTLTLYGWNLLQRKILITDFWEISSSLDICLVI